MKIEDAHALVGLSEVQIETVGTKSLEDKGPIPPTGTEGSKTIPCVATEVPPVSERFSKISTLFKPTLHVNGEKAYTSR